MEQACFFGNFEKKDNAEKNQIQGILEENSRNFGRKLKEFSEKLMDDVI